MIKIILNVILTLTLAAFINGCSQNTTKVTSDAKPAHSSKKQQVYVSTLLGIHNDKVYDSKNNWFKIQKNNAFSPEIRIGNDYPIDNEYSVLFFVDYKQISVEYNKQQKKTININMKKNSERHLRVNVKNLEEGKHNFMVLLIRKPHEYITKEQSIPGLEVYISQKRTLVVGENIENDTHFKKIEAQDQTLQGDLFITKNTDDSFEQQLNILKRSEVQNYWLRIPSAENNTKLALIAIAGNEQLNIKNPYIEIGNKGIVNVPLMDIEGISNLRTPKNFTVIAIEDDSSDLGRQPLYTNKITMVE